MTVPPARSRRPRLRKTREVTRVGAIDIGSNSIRQIIADVTDGGTITVLDDLKAAPRLGAGRATTGVLAEEAMARAVEALSRMATLARRLGCDRVVTVATSAVRDAGNGAAFLDWVRRETGLEARILTGEEEARLSFQSALAHFDLGEGRTAVMDIGGGSLELAFSVDGVLDRLISLPLGAVRLSEQCPERGSGLDRLRQLRRHVRQILRDAMPAREWRVAQVIGSGGTFTNLAGMYLARRGLPTAQTKHATRVSRADLEHMLEWLAQMSPAERAMVPGLNRERADIIVPGLAVAAEVLARLAAGELLVSRYGIREGLLLETARVTPRVADPGEARERSIEELAERCQYDARHARHVRELSRQLFDQIGERLGLVAADRQLLSDAALLHDIGYHIGYDRHHKHTYHLIVHAELLGITPLDQVILANIARYHRGARPKRSHRNLERLDKATRSRIRRLAALLRVADGLDRGHVGAVARVEARWSEEDLELVPVAAQEGSSLRLETWGASRKLNLLERELGAPVRVQGAADADYDAGTAGAAGAKVSSPSSTMD